MREPLRVGRPRSYDFVVRDLAGVVSNMGWSPRTGHPYGFVETGDGASYYFPLDSRWEVDYGKGSKVWFDVIEFPDRKENRFNAKFVEVRP